MSRWLESRRATRNRLLSENAHLKVALTELYDFVVAELDPEPHPVEAYLTDPASQRVARAAVRRVHLSRLPPDRAFALMLSEKDPA